MHQPLLCCCLLLLCHELHGHRLSPTVPGGGAAGTVKPPGTEVIPLPASPDAPSSHQAAARGLLDSVLGRLPQPGLPWGGVSCHDLLPEALEGFSQLPPLPQTLASAALALSLQGAGCPHQAEGLVLRLYGAVGVDDANALLLGIAGLPGTPRQGGRGRTALLFNVDQLAGPGPRRCSGLARLDSSLPAPTSCRAAGPSGRCTVLDGVPVVSTYYNIGTSIYYAFQKCTAAGQERASRRALDLRGNVGLGGHRAEAAIKAGVRSLISNFRQVEPSPPGHELLQPRHCSRLLCAPSVGCE
uniref:Apolipoprotein F n=1 Tax=Chelonoidis abingdonii TaxID=106734 RepID=A0A8C0INJ2_CHEAB